jgi:hypothetical protein
MTRRFDDISKPAPAQPFISRCFAAIICIAVGLAAAVLMVR